MNRAPRLYSLEEIDSALNQVAKQLNKHFGQDPVVVLSVLQGGLVTTGTLLPKLTFPMQLDSVCISRYRKNTQGGTLIWKQRPSVDLSNQNILIVDDIFDEGVTLSEVKSYCLAEGCREVVSMALLDKQHQNKIANDTLDYNALTVGDQYVFGFGMDYKGYLRNAPGIYAFPESEE